MKKNIALNFTFTAVIDAFSLTFSLQARLLQGVFQGFRTRPAPLGDQVSTETEQLVSLDYSPPGLRVGFRAWLAQGSQISRAYAPPPPLTLGDLGCKPRKVTTHCPC